MTNLSRTPALLALLMLVGACAPTKRNLPPEDYLATRAVERWEHVIARRWVEAYGYLTPGVRDVTTQDDYRAGLVDSKVNWTSAKAESVKCESADKCVALVTVHFELLGGMPGVPEIKSLQTVDETWLRSGREWYFMPRKPTR